MKFYIINIKKKEKRKNVDLLLNLGQYLNKTTRVRSQGKDIDVSSLTGWKIIHYYEY